MHARMSGQVFLDTVGIFRIEGFADSLDFAILCFFCLVCFKSEKEKLVRE